jgi:hypothetical protein
MLIGAMIAASDDLSFSWFGYAFLLINNLCTAAQGVIIKQKLINKVNIQFFLNRKMNKNFLFVFIFFSRNLINMVFCSTIHLLYLDQHLF